jgi:hypothetical protein
MSLIGDILFAIMAALYVARSASVGAIVLLAVAVFAETIVFWLSRRRFREARESYLAAERNYEEAVRHREEAEGEHRKALEALEVAKAVWEAEKSRRGFRLN